MDGETLLQDDNVHDAFAILASRGNKDLEYGYLSWLHVELYRQTEWQFFTAGRSTLTEARFPLPELTARVDG